MNYLKLGKNSFPLQIVTPTDSFVVVQLPCRPLYLTHKTVRPTLTLSFCKTQSSDLSSSQIQGRNGEILSFQESVVQDDFQPVVPEEGG